jgi:hypothetical protein
VVVLLCGRVGDCCFAAITALRSLAFFLYMGEQEKEIAGPHRSGMGNYLLSQPRQVDFFQHDLAITGDTYLSHARFLKSIKCFNDEGELSIACLTPQAHCCKRSL